MAHSLKFVFDSQASLYDEEIYVNRN